MADDFKAQGELKIDSNIPEVEKELKQLEERLNVINKELADMGKTNLEEMSEDFLDSYIKKGKEYENVLKRIDELKKKNSSSRSTSPVKRNNKSTMPVSYKNLDEGIKTSGDKKVRDAFYKTQKKVMDSSTKGIKLSESQKEQLFEAIYYDSMARSLVADKNRKTSPVRPVDKSKGHLARTYFSSFVSDEGEVVPSTYVDPKTKERKAVESVRFISDRLGGADEKLANEFGIKAKTNGQSLFGLNKVYEQIDNKIDSLFKSGISMDNSQIQDLVKLKETIVDAVFESIANTDNEELKQTALRGITGKKIGIYGEDFDPNAPYRRNGKLYNILQQRIDSSPTDFEAGLIDTEAPNTFDRNDPKKVQKEDRQAAQRANAEQVIQDMDEQEISSYIQGPMKEFISKAFAEGGKEGLSQAIDAILNRARDIQRGHKAESEYGTVSLSSFVDIGQGDNGGAIVQRDYEQDEENIPFYSDDLLDEENKKLQQESQETEQQNSKAIMSYREMLQKAISDLQELQGSLMDFDQRAEVGSVIQGLQKRLARIDSPNDKSVETNVEEAFNRLANYLTRYPAFETSVRDFSERTGVPFEEAVKQAMSGMSESDKEGLIRSQKASSIYQEALARAETEYPKLGQEIQELKDLRDYSILEGVDQSTINDLDQQIRAKVAQQEAMADKVKYAIQQVFGVQDREMEEIARQIASFSGSDFSTDAFKSFLSRFRIEMTPGERTTNTGSREERIPTVMPISDSLQGRELSPKEQYILGHGQGQMVMAMAGTRDPEEALKRYKEQLNELASSSEISAEKLARAQATVEEIQDKYGTKTTKSGTKVTWTSAKGFGIGGDELSADKRRYANAQKTLRNSIDNTKIQEWLKEQIALLEDSISRQGVARVGDVGVDSSGIDVKKAWGGILTQALQRVQEKAVTENVDVVGNIGQEKTSTQSLAQEEDQVESLNQDLDAHSQEVNEAAQAEQNKIVVSKELVDQLHREDSALEATEAQDTQALKDQPGNYSIDYDGETISESNEVTRLLQELEDKIINTLNDAFSKISVSESSQMGNNSYGVNTSGGSFYAPDDGGRQEASNYLNKIKELTKVQNEVERLRQEAERALKNSDEEALADIYEQINARKRLMNILQQDIDNANYTKDDKGWNKIGSVFLDENVNNWLQDQLKRLSATNNIKLADINRASGKVDAKDESKAIDNYVKSFDKVMSIQLQIEKTQQEIETLRQQGNKSDLANKEQVLKTLQDQLKIYSKYLSEVTYMEGGGEYGVLGDIILSRDGGQKLRQRLDEIMADLEVERAKNNFSANKTKANAVTGPKLNADGLTQDEANIVKEQTALYKRSLELQRDMQRAQQKVDAGVNVKENQELVKILSTQLALEQSKILPIDEANSKIGQQQVSQEAINRLLQNREVLDQNHLIQQQKINTQIKKQKGLFDEIVDGFKTSMRNLVDYSLAGDVIRFFENTVQQVLTYTKELNSAMVDLQIGSGETYASIYEMTKGFSELGEELGRSTQDVAIAADDWLRAGYAAEEANQLVEASMKLSTLGQIESADATSYLISVLKGWKLEAEEIESVVDRLTAVDMAAAISAGDLAESMSRANNSAQQAGVSLNTYIGYLTTVQDVTQRSASTVGEAFKTVFSRMGNIKAGKYSASAEEIQSGDFNEEEYESLNDVETVLDSIGVKLKENAQTYRDTEDVLQDIADIWDTLDQTSQNAVTTALAGTRQREMVLTLFENWDQVDKYAEIAADSYGTATEKMEAYTDSIEAAQNRITVAAEQLSMDLNLTDAIKGFYNVIAYVIDNLAQLGAAIGAFILITQKENMVRGLAGGLGEIGQRINVTRARSQANKVGTGFNMETVKNIFAKQGEEINLAFTQTQIEAFNDRLSTLTLQMGSVEKELVTSMGNTILNNDADLRNLQVKYLLGEITEQDYKTKADEVIETKKLITTQGELAKAQRDELKATQKLTELKEKSVRGTQLIVDANNKINTTPNGVTSALMGGGSLLGSAFGAYAGFNLGENIGGGLGSFIGLAGMGAGAKAGEGLGSFVNKFISGEFQKVFNENMAQVGQAGGLTLINSLSNGVSRNVGKVSAIGKTLGSTLLSSLGVGGLVSLGFTIGSLIWNGIEQANQERIQKAEETFKELKDEYDSMLNASVDTGTYDDLVKGVDSLGNNVSLTDEEYQEFLDISNQLADTFPELVVRTDEAGNSFLGVNGKVGAVTESIDSLIEAQQRLVDEQLLAPTLMDKQFGDTQESYQDLIDEANKLRAGLKQAQDKSDSGWGAWEDYYSTDKIKGMQRELQSLESQIESFNFGYDSQIQAAIRSNESLKESYESLDDTGKTVIDSLVNSLDFSQYGEGDGEKFISDIQNLVEQGVENLDKITPALELYYNLNPNIPESEYTQARQQIADEILSWDFIDQETKEGFLIKLGFRFDENGNLLDTTNPLQAIIDEGLDQKVDFSGSGLSFHDFNIEQLQDAYEILKDRIDGATLSAEQFTDMVITSGVKDSSLNDLAIEYEDLIELQEDGLTTIQELQKDIIEHELDLYSDQLGAIAGDYDDIISKIKIMGDLTYGGVSEKTPEEVLSQAEDYMDFAEYLADFDGKNWDVETLNKMFDYEELVPYLTSGDLNSLKSAIKDFLATSNDTINQTYQNIVANSEEASKTLLNQNKDLVDQFAENYGIDLTNFTTLKEAENTLNALTKSLMVDDYETWLSEMANLYDLDLENFTTAAAYKAAINKRILGSMSATEQAEFNSSIMAPHEFKELSEEEKENYGGSYQSYKNMMLQDWQFNNLTQETLDSAMGDFQKILDMVPEFTTSVGSAGSSSGSGDEFTYDDLLDALESLIDKEWEAMQVFDELTGKVTGETAYFEKMESLLSKKIEYYKAQAASALASGDQATYYDYESKLIQAEVDLANLDDERIQDEIDLAEAKGYSLDAMIKLYQELVKTADTEEDRVEYQNELNDAIREEYEERQRIREFEQDMLETALDRQRGTAWSDSGTYDTLLNAQMESYKTEASEALTEMERLTQQWIGVYMEQGKSFEEAKELAGQTKDVQDATKEYLDAIEKQADLVVTNVTDKLNEIEQRISDLEASKPQEWSSIDQIKEFSEQTIAMLEAKIPEIKAGLEDVSILTDEQIQELVDQLNDATTALMEAQISMREEIQTYQESQFSAVEWFVEGIIDDLNNEIEKLDDAYNPILEDLEDANDERERAIELEDLLQQKLNTTKEKERVKIVCSL